MVVATVAALLAAALFALAAALQHRSAGLVTAASGVRRLESTRFISQTLRHPLWLMGSVADVSGVGLHALALRDGPLTLVQPLLVTSVVFGLALRQVLERRRPNVHDIRSACLLVVGLVAFLAVATPANGSSQPADSIPTLVLVAVLTSGVAACVLIARRRSGNVAAVLYGCASGLLFAGSAGLLKQTMAVFAHGVGPLLRSWPLYALVGVGIVGVALKQLAYRSGPLRFSLPIMILVDPLASVVIGVAIFDERFRHVPVAVLGEIFGLVLVAIAAVMLTRPDPVQSLAASKTLTA
jgi:drug/metabolite transporter (DMT)-like permease